MLIHEVAKETLIENADTPHAIPARYDSRLPESM